LIVPVVGEIAANKTTRDFLLLICEAQPGLQEVSACSGRCLGAAHKDGFLCSWKRNFFNPLATIASFELSALFGIP
jgi:hypothetical protein